MRGVHRRRRNLASALVALIIIGSAGWLLGWSSILDVRQIEVAGLAPGSLLNRETVISHSGIRLGQPMARLNRVRVQRGLADLPRVKKVALIRHWPHRVELVITEREPSAVIIDGARYQLADSAGKVYAIVATPPSGIPLVSISGNYQVGLTASIAVLTSLPTEIQSQVVQLDVAGGDDVRLQLNRGVLVIWGSSEDSALKSRVLTTLLGGSGAKKIKRIDVSAPLAPTTS